MRWNPSPPALGGLLLIAALAARAAEAPYGLAKRLPCDTTRLDGTPEPPPPYRTRRVFERLKLDRPLYLSAEPGSDRLVVASLPGKIIAFKNDPAIAKTQPYLDLADHDLYGLTFHPQYENNGQVFVFTNGPTTQPSPRFNRIYRFEATGNPRTCDPKSKKLIIEWASNGHNGGDLGFGPDGFLYITSGDGTSDSDGDVTGQDLRDLCSGVLRLDVDRAEPGRGYAVPKDNPFLAMKDAKPELYAFGFRNPWRMTLDRKTGTFWIGDVGQDLWEMIHLLKRGGNYGWSVYEGGHPFHPQRKLGPGPVIVPPVVHPHSESRSITGGQFYAGKHKDLQDAYIYGDYSTGKIWGFRHENGKITWRQELANTRHQMVGFGLDHQGELYLVDYLGSIHILEPSPPATATNFPRKLSETGLFTSLTPHQPNPALIPYSVNSQLWSDGATKERFIALPGLQAIEFSEDGFWKFPEGTVLVKSFSLEREADKPTTARRIETRLMTFQQGEWQGYSYQWNDGQTEAVLVPAVGADKTFTIADSKAAGGARKQTWHYPSRVECMVCHSRAANYVLGLSTMQMNKVHDYNGIKDNQLRTLSHIGTFKAPSPDPIEVFESNADRLSRAAATFIPEALRERVLNAGKARIDPRWQNLRKELTAKLNAIPSPLTALPKTPDKYKKLADPYEAKADPTARARSYLQSNCAHCHVWAGGGNSAVLLDANTPLDGMRLIGAKPIHDTFGLPDARLLAPGSPERSVLIHRVAVRGRGQMPPLGSALVDEPAVAMLREWARQARPLPPPQIAGNAIGAIVQVMSKTASTVFVPQEPRRK